MPSSVLHPPRKMVVKYNPVLVNTGGMIVTRIEVEGLFLFKRCRCAGRRSPPARAGREVQFMRSLPSRFASNPLSQNKRSLTI
jgi:hypothetical protein